MAFVFVTGANGFIGRALSAELIRRGHKVRGLVRRGKESEAASGSEIVNGDPLDAASYREHVKGADTFVHLVGVSKPSPLKGEQFRRIDLVAAKTAIANASAAGIRHFLFVSVAQPAPVMHSYIAVRREVEASIRAAGFAATILRPWYVLGPGRRWPLAILPIYWILGAIPATRESAARLGLLHDRDMIQTMADAVDRPPSGIRILDVTKIRLRRLE
jgi:uncharacterized protein YbjT (DUF2867 family)